MFCPSCGRELNSNNVCGNPACPSYVDNSNYTNQSFESNNQSYDNNYGYNQNYTSSQNFNNSQYNGNNGFRDKNGISVTEMMEFVGPKNSDHYMEQWQKAQDNENFISWNWPAFFTNFLWFWHRKMYGLAAAIFGVNIVLRVIAKIIVKAFLKPNYYSYSYYSSGLLSPYSSFSSLPTLLISLIIAVLSALFANQLYIKHATKKIRMIKASSSMGVDSNMIFRRLRSNGGTTVAPIIFAIVLGVIIFLLIIIGLVALGSLSSSYRGFY
jgi:hypothetical protein